MNDLGQLLTYENTTFLGSDLKKERSMILETKLQRVSCQRPTRSLQVVRGQYMPLPSELKMLLEGQC